MILTAAKCFDYKMSSDFRMARVAVCSACESEMPQGALAPAALSKQASKQASKPPALLS